MSVQALGLRAYSDALQHFNKVDGSLKQGMPVGKQTLFSHTLDQSLLRDSVDKGETFGAQADFIPLPRPAAHARHAVQQLRRHDQRLAEQGQ